MRLDEAIKIGESLLLAGKFGQATDVCRQLLEQIPDQPQALNLTGLIAVATGKPDAALMYLARAVRVCPNVAEFHNNLGRALAAKDRLDEAMNEYQAAARLRPDYGQPLHNLAEALCVKHRWTEALAMYERAAALQPHNAQSLRNLATALMQTGQWDQAVEQGRAALRLEPGHAAIHIAIGISLKALGDTNAALAEYERALAIQPDCMEAMNNMANIYRETGRGRRALECYDAAAKLNPSRADIGSNRLYALHYDPDFDASAILREHRLWSARFAEPLRGEIRPQDNDRSPDRRLRIGYVSHHLSSHVVGVNLLPLLQSHDHDRFEIFCYSGAAEEDDVTGRLKACADAWREIGSLDDRRVCEMIRADRIDILVDLTLHMAHNRMLVFARKPAPVQATYLGYCSTSGLETIDYRFSDPHLDPPDDDSDCYVEKTIRLPGGYWCYQPPGTPPVQPAPMLSNGYVTFGCLNSFSKVSPAALDLWAKILGGIPGSRMILHCLPGSHRNEVLEKFAAAGVSAGRIEFAGYQRVDHYFQTYDRIDVALDPFPYAGGITTFDALWMGVPVITLSGRTAVGRGGRSILSHMGLPELIATTPQEYEELAGQFGRWIELRPQLRRRMSESTLLDSGRLAREVEAAYRGMWTERCG